MKAPAQDEQDPEKAREAFLAGMKARLEQGQAAGQSPEQMRESVMSFAHEEGRRQIPHLTSQVRSWRSGLRNFLIVGAMAFGVAIGLALAAEHRYAAPLCERYGAGHGLTYQGVNYPSIGKSSSTTSPPRCMFADAKGHPREISLDSLQPNPVIALLASFALQIDFIVPVAFIVIALIAVALRRRSTRST